MCTFLSERRFRMITSQFKNRYTHGGCIISPIVRTRFAHTCAQTLLHAIILYEILNVKRLRVHFISLRCVVGRIEPPSNSSNEYYRLSTSGVSTIKHCRPTPHARCTPPHSPHQIHQRSATRALRRILAGHPDATNHDRRRTQQGSRRALSINGPGPQNGQKRLHQLHLAHPWDAAER